MDYKTVVPATFLVRHNRFSADVSINGHTETVHVKNTGRLRELLLPGSKVWLVPVESETRKTKYDLVAVETERGTINIDSQLPNKLVAEWLDIEKIPYRREQKFGNSRLDFKLEDSTWMEVKGVTLLDGDTARFPDAPTERGARHVYELAKAKADGSGAVLAFVIQANGITAVKPSPTDPAFETAWQMAKEAGVKVWFFECAVTPRTVTIIKKREEA